MSRGMIGCVIASVGELIAQGRRALRSGDATGARDAFNDPERAARAREELGFLARELAGAVGLGGRDRKTGSDTERARVNVTRAIRTALKRIAEHDAALGASLGSAIRTGTFCVYEPAPGDAPVWDLSGPA